MHPYDILAQPPLHQLGLRLRTEEAIVIGPWHFLLHALLDKGIIVQGTAVPSDIDTRIWGASARDGGCPSAGVNAGLRELLLVDSNSGWTNNAHPNGLPFV
jgi:hypothetical protein